VAVVEGLGDHGCEYMTGGTVVVLGRTGRNFAAGMSGGHAYVLDEDGRFPERCNTALVELEALSMDDAALVAALLERHRELTGSLKASELLASWESAISQFVKVVPVEYRRALDARREEAHRPLARSAAEAE
jgi:glutamate synthase (NADPH) large chain